jgi:hypothetical protein
MLLENQRTGWQPSRSVIPKWGEGQRPTALGSLVTLRPKYRTAAGEFVERSALSAALGKPLSAVL